jgi:hypothetical protein
LRFFFARFLRLSSSSDDDDALASIVFIRVTSSSSWRLATAPLVQPAGCVAAVGSVLPTSD